MRTYLVKTPRILSSLFHSCIWDFKSTSKNYFLTFDDGPHPEVTPFVLDQLKKYNAKATFFLIGKNMIAYPEIVKRILDEGHRIGNHTQHHANGWKTETQDYINQISETQALMNSNLFRPPYGRITRGQINAIKSEWPDMKIIMWDILSGDFDLGISSKDCLKNSIRGIEPGSIIVFHDSSKASNHLYYALPRFLKMASLKKWNLTTIN
jgi:peptidoglycan/xylan/chitin deacetylase (PgdA/CDA1 family)